MGPSGDQDGNTDPGVFETGGEDAGKGWYLGSASGSTYSILLSACTYIRSDLHEFYQKYRLLRCLLLKNLPLLKLVLGIELDLSEFSPLSKSVSGKTMPSLLSELHSRRSHKPLKPVLPPKELGVELANDFFATINLLCPLLHRPSFYREVSDQTSMLIASWTAVMKILLIHLVAPSLSNTT